MRKITGINHVIGLTTLLLLLSFSYQNSQTEKIQIQWEDELEGDFSFTSEWSYAENIFVSQPHGELVCDGWCPEGVEGMRLKDGRIDPEQKEAYYALVDTSHRFHTFEGGVIKCYEFSETNFANCLRKGPEQLHVYTETNVSTHSSLELDINQSGCSAKIDYNSITNIPRKTYLCSGGWIKICKTELAKGNFRAQFDLEFQDPEIQDKLRWSGKIHTPIQP